MHRLLTFVTFAIFSFAANASDTEDVLALVKEHWEARNANDYQTPYDHLSDQGTLHANSDGSFFYVTDKGTVADFERDSSSVKKFNVTVRYPVATILADSVILVRYYLVGQLEFADGSRADNYRVRATHIWVKESGSWKTRSWHFSPLHEGGVFQR
jgi:ketosteroid isomerase-like protein